MNKITSTEFQKTYSRLTEPTEVTALGRVIGHWLPVGTYAMTVKGTVDEDHMEGDVRVVDKMTVQSVGIADPLAGRDERSFGAPKPAIVDPDQTVMGIPLKSSVADLQAAGHLPAFGAPRPAPKPKTRKA